MQLFPQVDLDLTSPNALLRIWFFSGYYLQFNPWFRADAAPHWIKPLFDGTCGEHAEANKAMLGLFNLVLKQINSNTKIIPEIMGATEVTQRYENTRLAASNLPQPIGDFVFNFDLRYHLIQSIALEDTRFFWHQYYPKVEFKNHSAELIHGFKPINFLSCHDELHLMGAGEPKERLLKKLTRNQGIPYKSDKNGDSPISVGGRLANFIAEPTEVSASNRRLAMALAIPYSQHGIPMIYYGDLEGETHNYLHFHNESKFQEDYQQALQAMEPDLDFKSLDGRKRNDPRSLNRGPLSIDTIKKAKEDPNSPLHLMPIMNRLHKERASLSSQRMQPLHTGSHKVLGYGKFTKDTDKKGDRPLATLTNLSSETISTYLHLNELSQLFKKSIRGLDDLQLVLGWDFQRGHGYSSEAITLDQMNTELNKFSLKGDILEIHLQPSEFIWFDSP